MKKLLPLIAFIVLGISVSAQPKLSKAAIEEFSLRCWYQYNYVPQNEFIRSSVLFEFDHNRQAAYHAMESLGTNTAIRERVLKMIYKKMGSQYLSIYFNTQLGISYPIAVELERYLVNKYDPPTVASNEFTGTKYFVHGDYPVYYAVSCANKKFTFKMYVYENQSKPYEISTGYSKDGIIKTAKYSFRLQNDTLYIGEKGVWDYYEETDDPNK